MSDQEWQERYNNLHAAFQDALKERDRTHREFQAAWESAVKANAGLRERDERIAEFLEEFSALCFELSVGSEGHPKMTPADWAGRVRIGIDMLVRPLQMRAESAGRERDALAARLREIEGQEPVAWLSIDCIGERFLCFTKPQDNDDARPLYAHPVAPRPVAAGDDWILPALLRGIHGGR